MLAATPPVETIPVEAQHNNAAFRERSIRLAVVSSLVSKLGTILFQLVSIPIAWRVLGQAEFGLYTAVNLSLTTVSLLEVGVGPALTHGLTRARAAGDANAQSELGSTAFFLMTGIATLAGLVLAAVLITVPLPWIYGADFAGRESALRPALWVGLAFLLLLFVLNLTDRIREGHLEVANNNFWGAIGNVAAAVSVGIGVWWIPEVWFLVVAVHGSMCFAKLGNTAMLWRKHPRMRPQWRHVRRSTAKHLFSDGIAFSTCCLVTGIVEYNHLLASRFMGFSSR